MSYTTALCCVIKYNVCSTIYSCGRRLTKCLVQPKDFLTSLKTVIKILL